MRVCVCVCVRARAHLCVHAPVLGYREPAPDVGVHQDRAGDPAGEEHAHA